MHTLTVQWRWTLPEGVSDLVVDELDSRTLRHIGDSITQGYREGTLVQYVDHVRYEGYWELLQDNAVKEQKEVVNDCD